MTWHPYFQLANAGWEQSLELKHRLEQNINLNKDDSIMKKTDDGDGRKTFHASSVGNSRFFSGDDVGNGLNGTISALMNYVSTNSEGYTGPQGRLLRDMMGRQDIRPGAKDWPTERGFKSRLSLAIPALRLASIQIKFDSVRHNTT